MELGRVLGVWAWFRSEVSEMIPAWFREIFLGIPKAVPLRFDTDTSEFLTGGKTIIAPDALIEGDISPKRIAPDVVDVMYPARRCFERKVTLPAASASAIEKVLALDTLRATPFSEGEIYWSYRRDHHTQEKLDLTQWIARREDIDAVMKRLKSTGLRVRSVLVEGNETGRPLRNLRREIAARNRIWRVLNLLCVLALVGLLSYRLLYPTWLDRQEIEALDHSLTDLRTRAVSLRQEAEVLRGAQTEQTVLLDVINRHVPLVQVLREVTVAMSDDVWINDLNYHAPQVSLSGSIKGSAAQLVLDLAKSGKLQNPRLSGSVSTGNDQRERFELKVEMGKRQ